MKAYEGIFIFPPDSTPDVRKNQLTQFDELIKKFGGSVIQKTELGKRFLGYTVRKFREGYVLAADFQMETNQAGEFRKALELQEEILKYMILVKKTPKKQGTKQIPAKPAHTAPAGPQAVASH